jgi:hypothetical protein
VQICKKPAIPDAKNSREVKVKGREDTRNGSTRQHHMKMADNVKGVVEYRIKTNVGHKHSA